MVFLRALLIAICAATATVSASPTTYATLPIVTLDRGKFIGTAADGVNKFLGVPFAKPPSVVDVKSVSVGDLRFRLPQALGPFSATHNATAFGLSCPQQATTLAIPNGLPQETVDYLTSGSGTTILDGEDCLTLNIFAPAHARSGSRLPVVVWIYGGGFEVGSSALYDGGVIVNRSMALKEPVVYVSINYRKIDASLAFGFLASQEVKDAGVGNLGLHDQRMALRWIQKYIHEFGGDCSKVTIWGQSAGSISVSFQMLANGGNTEGLFRAAFMQSGSPTPIGDINYGQQYYDYLVERTGCSCSSNTLACLRATPYKKLKAAVDSTPSIFTYQSLALAWMPRVDGVFLVDEPQKLIQQGKVARIPFVAGECDDEGTSFSLSQLNVTTDAQLRAYLSEFLLPGRHLRVRHMTRVPKMLFTPQFKRIASILGDFTFQAPRRFFLNNLSTKQNTWSFLSKRLKSLPILGSVHGSDYTTSTRKLLTLLDSQVKNITITQDTYRTDGMDFITELFLTLPL
ncbi:alpha beta-hydrolase [Lactarius akahatsu]|uniref:Carboxylic ester hydrolase n=1 Tax=Lactarius akahatsu TaxID=416441 RepID=A0AAD4QAJ7_9AGAM|nr:alpha beta-hydrolase [Lactarius akahatsu]